MIQSIVLLFIIISRLITHVGMAVNQLELLDVQGQLSIDNSDISAASKDFGGMTYGSPLAILSPSSPADVAALVRSSYLSNNPFPVSARGNGRSINGGVIIKMSTPNGTSTRMAQPAYSPLLGHYVDVWGGTLSVDVLNWTLEHGNLAPKSWTDYLYLSVGGTLSNGGISSQAFYHGPQISNVYELDVITGKGELVTCSEELRPELFFGVLGGLGQFGIITRARIALEPAPQRVRWIVCYTPTSKLSEKIRKS